MFIVSSKKLEMSAVVQRLDAQHLRTGLEARDHEAPVVAQREAADQLAGRRIERDDVRAEHAAAVLRDACR